MRLEDPVKRLFRHAFVNERAKTVRFGLDKYIFAEMGHDVRFGGVSKFKRASNIHVGSNVFFGDDCYFEAVSRITIGSGCMFGPRVFCIAGSHNYDSADLRSVPYDNRQIDLPVTIEDNVWVAGNVSIAPGTRIGEGSVIGLGATIAGNIPAYSVVVGQKGMEIKQRNSSRYLELVAANSVYGSKFAGKGFEIISKDSLR